MTKILVIADEPVRGSESALGAVDTAELAATLEAIRADLSPVLRDEKSLAVTSVTLNLQVSAEGRLALLARAAGSASIQVVFERG